MPPAATHQNATSQPAPHPDPGEHAHQQACTRKHEDQLKPRRETAKMSQLNVNMVPKEREDLCVVSGGVEPPTFRFSGVPSPLGP
jgi:hypothetical protein